jgi:RNA polymerase subunit RPABC4/transcription elongation factor Spt4
MPVDEDDFDDRELPDPSDMDQDDYTVMSRCPNCKKMIDEQSEVCPRCGYFISVEDAPQKSSLWIVILIVLTLLTIFYACLR